MVNKFPYGYGLELADINEKPKLLLRKRESSHKQYDLENKILVGNSMNMPWEPTR